MIDRRHRVLPQLRLGDRRPQVAGERAHVAVQQLEPGAREGVGELLRILVEALGDRRIDRIDLQGQVRRQHHRRVPLLRVVRIGHSARCLGILRLPLLGAGRALRQLPLVLIEILEEPVVPLRRVVVQAPSRPLVMVSPPLPVPYLLFQPRP